MTYLVLGVICFLAGLITRPIIDDKLDSGGKKGG